MWTRRIVLKALAAGGGMLAMPTALRTAFSAEDAHLLLRLTAAPARLAIRSGSETRGLRYTV